MGTKRAYRNLNLIIADNTTITAMAVPDNLPSAASRPALIRSATAKPPTTQTNSRTEATPLLSRPIINRTTSAATVLQNPNQLQHPSTKSTTPSLLRRAAEVVTSTFDLTISNDKNKPATPSHWTDYTHRKPLLQIWDTVNDAAATGKYAMSITRQLVTTEKRLLQRFPELAEGDEPLTREWMEYVLGLCMRHPFCASENMPRWQVLGSGAGARGNWGPF